MRAAGREQLLVIRSLLDYWIEKLGEKLGQGRQARFSVARTSRSTDAPPAAADRSPKRGPYSCPSRLGRFRLATCARWFEAVNVAFGEDVTDEQWALDQKITEPERVLGVYDGDKIVGGGAIFTFRMTVPGGRKADVAGVTMVGVMPTHRRQGALRALMARQLADVRERGEPIAALWASEGSIYQRFGYGLAIVNGAIDLERDRATFRQPVEPSGQVELRDVESARPAIKKVYDVYQARTPGFYERHDDWLDVSLSDAEFRRNGMSKRHNAVLVRDGEEVGYALYRIKGDWLPTGPANTLFVNELIGLDAEAVQQLWRYVFGVDLMHNIRARLGPVDHPLLLMLAEPRRLQLRATDGVWLRIVDVKAALEARGYAADGSIVLDVSDSFMPEVARPVAAHRRGRRRTRGTDYRRAGPAARYHRPGRRLHGRLPIRQPRPSGADGGVHRGCARPRRRDVRDNRRAVVPRGLLSDKRSHLGRSVGGVRGAFWQRARSAEQQPRRRPARRPSPTRESKRPKEPSDPLTASSVLPEARVLVSWPLRDDQTLSTAPEAAQDHLSTN